jgi:hypothetical protein
MRPTWQERPLSSGIVWLVVAALVSVPAFADVLVTKSGAKYEGTVTDEGDNYVLVGANGAVMTWPKGVVKEVIKGQGLTPRTSPATRDANAAGPPGTVDVTSAPAPEPPVGLFPIQQDGKWGFINRTGEVVIKPRFDGVIGFSDGLAAATVDKKMRYIDKTGKEVLQAHEFESASAFQEGMAAVAVLKDGVKTWGFIDKEGKIAVKPKFSYVWGFREGLAAVFVGIDGWGYVNKSGNLVIPARFRDAGDFSEGLARVNPGEDWGYIGKKGEFAIAAKFAGAGDFSGGLAPVQIGTKGWGYIDKTGKTVIPPQYGYADKFSDGLARITVDVQMSGKVEVNGRPILTVMGKDGYIDTTGKSVIDPQFQFAGAFSEGLARVMIDGKYGYIDKSGKVVVKPPFNRAAGDFSQGLAQVTIGDKSGYIDKTGNWIWKPTK